MNSKNPMFKDMYKKVSNNEYGGNVRVLNTSSDLMTIEGTVNKSLILLTLIAISATWAYMGQKIGLAMPMAILGLILAVVTSFKVNWAHVTAPAYALCEGVVLGGISSMAELAYPGVPVMALLGTIGTFAAMFFAYKTKMIQVTQGFTAGMRGALMGILLISVVSLVLSLFGVKGPMNALAGSGPIGLCFGIFCVGIASFCLILDFHNIAQMVQTRANKQFEWYGAFGLMVTLIWLYVEILNLLMKLRNRD